MSDPLSAASSVVGVVSLGLTVCDGLISYFSAYKGQDQFVDSLTQRAENLQGCLTFLQQALPLWTVRFSNAPSQIEQHITACQASILILSNKLSGLKMVQGPSLRRDKLHHFAQKAAFPFKKGTIVELSGFLDGLQENLNTILCIVGLEASSMLAKTQTVTNTKIDAVLSASGVMTTRIQTASQDLSSLLAEVSTIRNDLQAVKSILGPGVHAVTQRSEIPSPTPTPQTWQLPESERGQIQAQHLPGQAALTKTGPQLLQGRPTSSTTKASKWSHSSICLCRRTKTRRPTGVKILFVDYSQTQEHEKDCPCYLPSAKKRKLDILISYRSVLIARGIRCMASLVTGSAGTSISATIDWIPIVSSQASEAIQLLERLSLRLSDSAEPQALLDGAYSELMRLFEQRKAHPREVDEYGDSVLTYACNLIMGLAINEDVHHSLLRLFYSLASLGAKASLYNFTLTSLFATGGRTLELGVLAEDLTRMGALDNSSDRLELNMLQELTRYRQWHHVFENGPLSRAILRRDPEEAIRLLQHKPSLVAELNDSGHSLLHLSHNWPLGLVLLLKYGASSLVNHRDNCGYSPGDLKETRPSGIASMVLIAAGAEISDRFLETAIHKNHDREQVDVAVDALLYRRKQLQHLAMSHLLVTEPVKVPDEQATGIYTALEQSGIRVPGALSVRRQQTTVYHVLHFSHIWIKQKLFDAGFSDVDGLDHFGYTPLMGRDTVWNIPLQLASVRWLCDRGANLLYRFPGCTESDCREEDEHRRPIALRAIHSAAFGIGRALFYLPDVVTFSKFAQTTGWFEFLSTILCSDISDGCSCACSSEGCVPVLNLFTKPIPINGPQSYWFLRWVDLHLPYAFPAIFLKVLRLCTFEALGLTHTCCRRGCRRDFDGVLNPWKKPCPFSTPIDEEIQEIQDEERHLISLLDSVMAEFTEQWLWPTSEWGVDDFMSKVWRPRLRQIQKERAQMSVEEQAQMRCLGVKIYLDDEGSLSDAEFDESDDESDSESDGDRFAEVEPSEAEQWDWDIDKWVEGKEEPGERRKRIEAAEADLREIRAFFTDVEVAEILKEAARVNGLEDYDIWFRIIGKPDPRQA